MGLGFGLTDYRIRSLKVFRGAVYAFALIHLFIILAELFLDLRSTSFDILIPSSIVSIIVILFSLRSPDSNAWRLALITLMYLVIEAHFLYNPQIFHVIGYWSPLVPLLALILLGMRASQVWFVIIMASHIFNAWLLNTSGGGRYEAVVEPMPFLVSSFIFTTAILSAAFLLYYLLGEAYSRTNKENAELTALKKSIEDKRNLLEKYLQQVISFSKDDTNYSQGRVHLFKAICKTVSVTLDVSRVSVWLLDDNNQKLERKHIYEVDNVSDDIVVLQRKDFPAYFAALESKPFIVAPHAWSHPETREFAQSYLEPLDIISLLDCAIVLDGLPVGVICCEHRHRIRNWNAEDTLFVQSMCDFISLSFKNDRITNLLFELRRKNFELVEKNNEIETMNEELNSLNEELTTVNETLEEMVRKRTKELETQNIQLTEYAFINSHLLRAPLTRILGLSQLISTEVSSVHETQLIDALISSTNELDVIIRRISEILYDGNNFTRDDIKEIIERNLNQRNQRSPENN